MARSVKKHVKNCQETKGRGSFSLDGKYPITFHKQYHGISIWTKNGTNILKSVSKEVVWPSG